MHFLKKKKHAFIHSNIYHICIFQIQKVENFINAFKKIQNFIDVFSQMEKGEKYGESFVHGSLNSQA